MNSSDIINGAERAALLDMRSTTTPSDARPQSTLPSLANGEVNPVAQPKGPGVWVFRSDAAEEAAKRFANAEGFGTSGVARTSADQIWKLRQMYQRAIATEDSGIRVDRTADIELTWVPQTRPKLILKLRNKNASTAVTDLRFGIDKHTGLAYKPKNGFECRQDIETGRAKQY